MPEGRKHGLRREIKIADTFFEFSEIAEIHLKHPARIHNFILMSINFKEGLQGNGWNGAYRIQAAGRGAAPPDAEPGGTGIWIFENGRQSLERVAGCEQVWVWVGAHWVVPNGGGVWLLLTDVMTCCRSQVLYCNGSPIINKPCQLILPLGKVTHLLLDWGLGHQIETGVLAAKPGNPPPVNWLQR